MREGGGYAVNASQAEGNGGIFSSPAAAAEGGEGGEDESGDNSLNLSLGWEGFILEDVELRRDFMAELLGLPVDVPTAFVRKAVLHVPWYTLMLG